jgi:hypothetical protein
MPLRMSTPKHPRIKLLNLFQLYSMPGLTSMGSIIINPH